MFSLLRPILFPTLIASFFVVPLLYQKSTTMAPIERHQSNNRGIDYYGARSSQPYQSPPLNQSSGGLGTFSTSPLSNSSVTALPASTARPVTELPQLSAPAIPTLSLPSPSLQANSGGPFLPVSNSVVSSTPGVDFSQLTPDFGAAETYTFRGDANGPDLTSQPVQFVPISNFQEVFRFDVSPVWVKQRWDRLTAIPAEQGLHGLRTALVTGTNTWDLNGSLTYFFDQNHRTQRIAFRGWVGDPSRLVNLVTQQFGLRPQPTHWAGLYTASFGGAPRAGLIMKDPDSIDRRNRVQQTAVIMEINQPAGDFKLSDEFLGFLQSAIATQ